MEEFPPGALVALPTKALARSVPYKLENSILIYDILFIYHILKF